MTAFADRITECPEIYDAARIYPTHILSSLWKNDGVIIGAPTYEVEMFPPVAHVLDLAVRKRIHGRKSAYFGSFGWSGGAKREFEQFAEVLKWDILDTLEFRGGPTLDEQNHAETFGYEFARKILTSPD